MASKRISDWLAGPSRRNPLERDPSRLHNDTIIDSTTDGWRYLLGAMRSKAPGQFSANVLELARHLTGPVSLAVNVMCNQAAAAEMKLMERTYDRMTGDIELPHTEPVCEFYADPNDEDDWQDIAYGATQQIQLTGMSLTWIPGFNPEERGRYPGEMYVLPTSSCLPWPPSPIYPHGSYLVQPYYPYGPFSTIPSYQSAAGARIPAEQVIRIKNQHPILRYDGYALLTQIKQIVDTLEGIDRARWNTQQQGTDFNVAIEFDPQYLNPNQVDLVRLRRQIEAAYAGPENSGKILFAPFGGSVKTISNTPKDMAWTEGWNQLVAFVLAAFGTPKGIAGLQDDTSYATLYASLKQFYILSLQPLLGKTARKHTKAIIRPCYGNDLYMLLTPERIDDRDLLERQLSNDAAVGIRTNNEWRKLRDLPPTEEPWGKERATTGGAQAQAPEQDSQSDMLEDLLGEADKGRPKPGAKDEDMQQVNNSRPVNQQGHGALGPRKSLHGDRLAAVLEKAKTNGTAHPPFKADDGAREFLRT